MLTDGGGSHIYRRVRRGDASMNLLLRCNTKIVRGFPTPLVRAEYGLYELIDPLDRRRGYLIVKCGLDPTDERNRMYFIREKK